MEEEKEALVQKLIDDVNEISAIKDYRPTVRKQYYNLARRLKLLTPMFEEIRDSKEPLDQDSQSALASLKSALDSAIEMLRFGSEGSKIYIVIEEEKLTKRFQDITNELEQALSAIPYEVFDMSDEVKEQVDLVLGQFRRAKGRVEPPDTEIYEDLVTLNNQPNDSTGDPDALRRLLEKLQLTQISDLTQESLALHEMVAVTGGDPDDNIEKMSMTLKKIKDFVLTEIPEMDAVQEPSDSSGCSAQTSNAEGNLKAIVIPDDFRCPISLELMKDPVIVSTGQTYERACIEKWLEAGHVTCPKTQQALTSTTLTPNYVLRSLIAQWCEANGIEPPKRPSSSRPKRTSACSPAERTIIDNLLWKLNSSNHEDLLSAAGEIRLLAKRNADNRVAIAEAGAIPLLVNLLSTPDSRIQEHVVTALLNLSICEDNKGIIISSGALPGIVHVLKKGSMEARENSAATLFSLSVMNGNANKITIGSSGAIPPLVTLLNDGTQRGKKDAATALFNLCIYQGNKGKAVRAGVVPTLMRLLTLPQDGMVDEALAILTILASHPEGKLAIGAANAVPILVDAIENGSPRNKENAAAVLVHLCSGDQQHLLEAKELGVMVPLLDLAQNGTERGKRKAVQLLERMYRFLEQQKQLEAQADVPHTHHHHHHRHHLAQLLQLPSLDTDLEN